MDIKIFFIKFLLHTLNIAKRVFEISLFSHSQTYINIVSTLYFELKSNKYATKLKSAMLQNIVTPQITQLNIRQALTLSAHYSLNNFPIAVLCAYLCA